MGIQHNSPDESGVSEKGPMLNVAKEIEDPPPDRNSDEDVADSFVDSNPSITEPVASSPQVSQCVFNP